MNDSMLSDFSIQPDNPNKEERYALARFALAQKGRLDDFDYIIKEMSPPPPITTIAEPGEFKNVKIGIIGGGLAGLAAAFELRKLGADITIFEAVEDRIGGRVYTHYFNSAKTLYGEFGAMRMPVTHETLWHYINIFKLHTRPFIQNNENGLIYLRGVRVRNDPMGKNVMENIYPRYALNPWERRTPWQRLLYYGVERALLYATPQERSEILQIKPWYHSFIECWDRTSNRQMMESTGITQDAINLLQNFIPLAGQNMYNSYLDYIQELYSVDLSYLYEIPGGIANLSLSFYESLIKPNSKDYYTDIPLQSLGKVTFKMGNWVEGIYGYKEENKVSIVYKNKSMTYPKMENYDYVLCTIPFSTLRTIKIEPLFSYGKMQAIKEVNYITAQKSLLLCKKRFWEEGGPHEQIIGGASYTDLPITQVYYPSSHVKHCTGKVQLYPWDSPYANIIMKNQELSKQPGVLLASYNFHQEAVRLSSMSGKLLLREILHNLEALHGLPKGYLDNIALELKTLNWANEPWFRGALCYYTPQQKQLFSYVSVCPEYENRVFFAGEHVSKKHRWMQGALQSGMEAANALAIACKSRRG